MTGTLTVTAGGQIGGKSVTITAVSADTGRKLTIQANDAVNLDDLITNLASLLGMSIPQPPQGFWSPLLDTDLNVTAWIASQESNGVSASLDLSYVTPVTFFQSGSKWYELFGTLLTVDGLVVSYSKANGGLRIRAKVETTTRLSADTTDPGGKPGTKQELVSFPFPQPATDAPTGFSLNFFGIGQRVGPGDASVGSADPLNDIFKTMERNFGSNDPTQLLRTLATSNFYQPDRDWFVAADVGISGISIQALFNDPVLYGLRITVNGAPYQAYSGLLFEILYQKVTQGLGVYYGALTLPDNMRRIEIDGAILILPGFSLWVYTNGDFRVNVGWPLGSNSIGLIVGPLTGSAGFYFAKLRTSDNPNPARSPGTALYNPILQFGIEMQANAGFDISEGPLSASMAIDYHALLQGVIAWQDGGNPSGAPDHYWFAGSVALIVVIEGSVDFTIIKASLTILFIAQAAVAYETGCETVLQVSAEVSVDVSVHVTFCTIHLSFDMTVSETLRFATGTTPASLDGPHDKGLIFTPAPGAQSLPTTAGGASETPQSGTSDTGTAQTNPPTPTATTSRPPTPKPAAPDPRIQLFQTLLTNVQSGAALQTIPANFALLPTVIFSIDSTGQLDGEPALVAALVLGPPAPAATTATPPATLTAFETLAASMLGWLLLKLAGSGAPHAADLLSIAADALGHGSAPPGETVFKDRDDFIKQLAAALSATISLQITGATAPSSDPSAGPLFPMPDGLTLTPAGQPAIDLSACKVADAYIDAVSERFPGAGANGSGSSGPPSSILPTLNGLILTDYLLLLLRRLVQVLVPPASPGLTWTADIATALAACDFGQLAGFVSRFLVSGLMLPDVPADGSAPSATAPLQPLFKLSGQQFPGTVGTNSATLTLSPPAPPGANPWLALEPVLALQPVAGAQGVTASISVPAKSTWGQPIGTLTPKQTPGISSAPMRVALNRRTALTGGTDGASLALPPQIWSGAGPSDKTLSVKLSATPAGGIETPVAGTAGLLVSLSISRVQRPASTAAAAGTVWLPGVYQVHGTDAATLELLFDAVFTVPPPGAPQPGSIALYVTPPNLNALRLVSSPGLALVRTNPPPPIATDQPDDSSSDPVASAVAAAQPGVFLRLLWEACAAQGSGFYLADPTHLGNHEDDVFGASHVVAVDLLVKANAGSISADAPVPVPTWANCVTVGQNPPAATIMAGVFRAHGEAVTVPAPSTRPGAIGFEIDLPKPPAVAPGQIDLANLYHLVQYAPLPPAGAEPQWSLPVGPTIEKSTSTWRYRQIVSAATNGGSSPYALIGTPLQLLFRQVDVFGNPMPAPNPSQPVTFTPLYTDRLIAPGAWPGVQLTWVVTPTPNAAGKATLTIEGTCDPSHLASAIPGQQAATGQAAQNYYTTILNQLNDPNVAATLTSNLAAGGPVSVSGANGATLQAALTGFAAAIQAALQAPPAAGSVLTLSVSGTIDVASAIAASPDIQEVGVWLALSRSKFVDPAAAAEIPEIATARSAIRPKLHQAAPASPSAAGAVSPLRVFAQNFEQAFRTAAAGQDSPTGSYLRLAQRAGNVTDDTPDLYAVRFAPDGIDRVPTGSVTSYALRPLSTQLLTAQLPDKSYQNNVDLDAVAAVCLRAIDSALSPGRAAALAAHWPDQYTALLAAKQKLARAIPHGLVKVLDSDPEGDLISAQQALEAALCRNLASAITVTSVVQAGVDLKVKRTGDDALDLASAPVLWGDVSTTAALPAGTTAGSSVSTPAAPPARTPATAAQPTHFFFSSASAELPKPPASDSTRWLTTLLSVAEPTGQTELETDLFWTCNAIQHDFETTEREYGYEPSAWLQFILADTALKLTAARAQLPLPLWFEPTRPHLTSHVVAPAATGSDQRNSVDDASALDDDIKRALRWAYTVQLSATLSAQDELFLLPGWDTAAPAPAASAPTVVALQALLNTAAGFQAALPAMQPALAALDVDPPGTDATDASIANFVTWTTNFAASWDALARSWSAGATATPSADGGLPGTPLKLRIEPSQLIIRAAGTSPPPDWPATISVNNQTFAIPAPVDGQVVIELPASSTPAMESAPIALALTWSPVQLGVHNSGDFLCWVERNPDLVSNGQTAADFIFSTPRLSFPTPVVPLLKAENLPTILPTKPLQDMLATVLNNLAAVAAGAPDAALSVACTYACQLLPQVPAAGPGAKGLQMRLPVLMGTDIALAGAHATLPGQLAQEVSDWLAQAKPVNRDGTLSFAITLFGTPNFVGAEQLPLAHLTCVVAVPPDTTIGFLPPPAAKPAPVAPTQGQH